MNLISNQDKEQYFCLDLTEPRLLDFPHIYGNSNPVVLEIGSGKGEFIAIYSRFHPAENILGIELKQRRIVNTLKRLDILKNSNVRLIRLFVDENIGQVLPPESISEVIINHPDPWPKNKHVKKRLINHAFLTALHHILKHEGLVKVSTDDMGYVRYICKVFRQHEGFETVFSDGYTLIAPEYHLPTYYSKQAETQGRNPAFMLFRKK